MNTLNLLKLLHYITLVYWLKRYTYNKTMAGNMIYPMWYHSMGSWHLALYNFLQHIFQ